MNFCESIALTKDTISNDCNPLPGEIIAPVPSSRVHHLSLEVFQSGNVRLSRLVELANGRDEKVRVEDIRVSILAVLLPGHSHADSPFRLGIIPASLVDGRVEADVLV